MSLQALLSMRCVLIDRMDYWLHARDNISKYKLYRRKYIQVNNRINEKYRTKEQVNKQMQLF